jgi:hypothetical protein
MVLAALIGGGVARFLRSFLERILDKDMPELSDAVFLRMETILGWFPVAVSGVVAVIVAEYANAAVYAF